MDFIQTRLKIVGCEPSDPEVLEHLNLSCRSGAVMYGWVDAMVAGTFSTLITEAAHSNVDIVFDDPVEWLVLPVSGENKICNSFDDCMVLLYVFVYKTRTPAAFF